MRLVSFLHQGAVRPGVLQGNSVLPILSAGSLREFAALPKADRSAPRTGDPLPLGSVRLDAPVRPAKNVFCVGRNYLDHAAEVARARGITDLNLPSVPTFFTKAPTAIAAPDETLDLSPEVSGEYDWEAELGVVIGERCRDVPAERALDVIFGYTCINDVTARDLQRAHQQWFKGKSLDHTCPIGPWIVTPDELGDPQHLDIALRVNGVVKQHSNTAKMIFDVRAIVASLSRGLTLEPGDVIATGTPDGVGFARKPPEFLRDGDVMEVEIAGIGILRNTTSLRATVVTS
jgi:2-keto-4-pentenoate hydratase/2-oxohepta-3-ene-1,7-dioic acid hydratase in catechol pathway